MTVQAGKRFPYRVEPRRLRARRRGDAGPRVASSGLKVSNAAASPPRPAPAGLLRRVPARRPRTRCWSRGASRSRAGRSRSSARRPPTSRRSCSSTWTCTGRASTPAARPSPASASTCCSATAATTPGAPPRRARTSSTRSPCRSASRTAPSPRRARRTTATTASACRSTCWTRRTAGRRARPTRRRPARRRCTPSARNLGLVDGARHGARQAGGIHQAALDLLPRGRLGARLRRAERPDEDPRARDFQRAASKIGFTFNWFYIDHSHIAYFNSGNNPVRARADQHALPGELEVRVEELEPGPVRRRATPAVARIRRRSTRRSWRAGTTSRRAATGRPTTTSPTARSTARSRSPTASGAASAAARKMSITAADRRDGERRDGRPARDEGAALRAARARPSARARGCGMPWRRCAPGCARAGTGSTATATASTSTRRRSRSSTAGGRSGCGPSSGRRSARGRYNAPASR